MGRPPVVSDLDLVVAVARDRMEYGACTVGSLARRLGIGRTTVANRVAVLVRSGELARTRLAGSIRIPVYSPGLGLDEP